MRLPQKDGRRIFIFQNPLTFHEQSAIFIWHAVFSATIIF